MASKKFEKGSEEWQMFMKLWELVQRYYTPDVDSDDYHENILRDTNEFRAKYDTPWGRALSKAVIWAVQDYEMSVK